MRTLRGMRITFLPHALQKMAERGISQEEARLTIGQADEEGAANFGRLYAQKVIGYRRLRVIYNRGVLTRPWWSRSCSAEGKVGVLEDLT